LATQYLVREVTIMVEHFHGLFRALVMTNMLNITSLEFL